MGTVNGVNYTKQLDPYYSNVLARGTNRGKVRVFTDTYECSSLVTSANTILMGHTLPTGAQVIRVVLGNDLLGFGTVDVGTQGTTTKFLTGVSMNAARLTVGPDTIGGMAYTVTGVTDNIIRITTKQNSLFNGTLTLTVYYTED